MERNITLERISEVNSDEVNERYDQVSSLVPILGRTSMLLVSGRPLFVTNPDIYYNDSLYVEDIAVRALRLRTINIPVNGHRHLNECFIGSYSVLYALDITNNRDYAFGIRPELRFSFTTQEPISG